MLDGEIFKRRQAMWIWLGFFFLITAALIVIAAKHTIPDKIGPKQIERERKEANEILRRLTGQIGRLKRQQGIMQ